MNAMTELENLQALHPDENFVMVGGAKVTVTEIMPFKKGGHHPLVLLDKVIEIMIAKNEVQNEDAIYGVIAKIVSGSFDPESKLQPHVIGTMLHCSNITQAKIETCNIAQVIDIALKIVEVNISFFTEAVSKVTATMTKIKS